MREILFFDNCMWTICNRACFYCRGKNYNRKKGYIIGGVDTRVFKHKLLYVDRLVRKYFSIGILKVSGYGEFLLIPKAIDLLKTLSENYPRVQLITNATLLNEKKIKGLSSIKNLNICLSLDSIDYIGNLMRNMNKEEFKVIIDNLYLICKYKIPLEINSVINRLNLNSYIKLLDFLLKFKCKVTNYPFYLRGPTGWQPKKNNFNKIFKYILKNYEKYAAVLPHKEYIKEFNDFINFGRRNRCLNYYANLNTVSDYICLCACGLKGGDFLLGRITSKNLKSFVDFNFQKFIMQPAPLSCKYCFSHYEIISLFLRDKITLSDLMKIDLYNNKNIKYILLTIKNNLRCLTQEKISAKNLL